MLMNNLSIIVRHCRVYAMRKLMKYDIGHAEQIIIMFLSNKEKVNQETIAKHFMIDKGTIAKTLSKLEEKNLIIRVINPDNQREKLISLADKGKEIIGYMGEILEDWNRSAFEGINEADLDCLQRITTKIVANTTKVLEKEWSEEDGTTE